MRYLILLAIFLLPLGNSTKLNAQSIMLIPFHKKGENKRLIIENDPCYRIIETKIMQVFRQNADYDLYNHRAALDRIENLGDMINRLSKVDLIALILQNADADIYIEVDYEIKSTGGSRNGHQLIINLSAYRTSDGLSQAGTVLDSRERYTTDCVGLATQAFYSKAGIDGKPNVDLFVEELISKIEKPIQAVNIEFFLSEDANLNYYTKLADGKLLMQAIQQWIDEHKVEQKPNNSIGGTYLKFSGVVLDVPGEDDSPAAVTFALYDFLRELKPSDETTEDLSFEPTVTGQNIIFHLK